MVRDTQVTVFASQKGGSGKTTLSSHMAVEADRAGAGPVSLIDTDPYGSLATWSRVRASAAPAFSEVSVSDLKREIEELSEKGFRHIIVDTPPALTSSIEDIITVADLVVMPIRPSPHDLRAVGPTVDMIEGQRKSLVFVVNAAAPQSTIIDETTDLLMQHGTVAPVTLHQRVDFAASMIDGRTVGEVDPASRSGTEIVGLWAFLADRLLELRNTADNRLHATPLTFGQEVLMPGHLVSEFSDLAAMTADLLSNARHPGPDSGVSVASVS